MGLVGLLDTFQRSLNEEDNVHQVAPRTDKLPLFKRLITDLRAVILGQDRIGYIAGAVDLCPGVAGKDDLPHRVQAFQSLRVAHARIP